MRMPSIGTLAWRHWGRKQARAALLVVSVALAAAALFGSIFFLRGMERSFTVGPGRLGADLMVVPAGSGVAAQQQLIAGTPSLHYMDQRVLDQVRGIFGVAQATPQLYVKTVRAAHCGIEGEYPMIGIDPDTDFTLKPFLAQGRKLGDHEVMLGYRAAGVQGIESVRYELVQHRLLLLGQTFIVRSVLYPTGGGADSTLFVRLQDAREAALSVGDFPVPLKPTDISAVLVNVAPGTTPDLVANRIKQQIPGVEVLTGLGLADTVRRQLAPLQIAIWVAVVLVLVFALLQVVAIFSAIIYERSAELAVLRAFGASRGAVLKLLLGEAAISGLLGGALGSLFVFTILYDYRIEIQEAAKLPLAFPGALEAIAWTVPTALATTGICVFAAWFAARSTLRRDPYTALREGA